MRQEKKGASVRMDRTLRLIDCEGRCVRIVFIKDGEVLRTRRRERAGAYRRRRGGKAG